MNETMKFIKKHESFKLLIIAVILISASLISWNVLKFTLNTENPVLVVVSGSMVPTLNVGDLIIIKGTPAEQISLGTIIVFHSPADYDTLIVHRVIDKMEYKDDLVFKTKGDFNYYEDNWLVPSTYIIGSYIGRIPYVGIVIMKLKEPLGMSFIIFLLLLMIFLEIFEEKKKKKVTSPS